MANPKGRSLCVMHALFTTMATEFDAHTDLMAERLVLLGGVARGTVRTAATHSRLPEYPGTLMDGDAHVRALTEYFASYATALRADIAHATEVEDARSAALYTDISRGVDTRLGFLEDIASTTTGSAQNPRVTMAGEHSERSGARLREGCMGRATLGRQTAAAVGSSGGMRGSVRKISMW